MTYLHGPLKTPYHSEINSWMSCIMTVNLCYSVTDNYLLAFTQGLKSFLFSFFFLLFSLKSLLFLSEKNNERPVNQATDFKPLTNCNKLLYYSIVFLSVFSHYISEPVDKEVGTPVRWGNPLRWGNPPVHMISHFNLITFTWQVG